MVTGGSNMIKLLEEKKIFHNLFASWKHKYSSGLQQKHNYSWVALICHWKNHFFLYNNKKWYTSSFKIPHIGWLSSFFFGITLLPMLNWDGYMGSLQSIKKDDFVTFVTCQKFMGDFCVFF